MKRFFIFCIFSLFNPIIFGENIFVYNPKNVKPGQNIVGSSCQAVRLKGDWYLTAAHCVDIDCKDACVVEVYTENGPFRTTQENVSWLKSKSTKRSSYDLALVNFQDAKIPVGSFKSPSILIIDKTKLNTPTPKILNKSLNIPSAGLTSWGKVFYGPLSKIIFTRDVRLSHGLSGSGVFIGTDNLIAITSAATGRDWNTEFSVFSVFDDKVEQFLGQVPSLYFKHITTQDFEDIDTLPKEEKNTLISLDRD